MSQKSSLAWKIIDKKTLINHFLSVYQYSIKIRLFSGDWSTPFTRIMAKSPQAVVVIPFDPSTNEVVMVEQFRIGALNDTEHSPWLLEFVAGGIYTGEDAASSASRELQEETGLDAKQLIPIYSYYSSPGLHNEKIHLFCAVVDSTKTHDFCGIAADNEDIKTHRINLSDAIEMAKSGQLNNGAAIIGTQWLALNAESLNR